MAIYNFNSKKELFSTVDKIPDPRTDEQKENSPISLYNHDIPDIALEERRVQELIEISGVPIIAYKYKVIEHVKDSVQDLWNEEQTKIYDSGTWVKGIVKMDLFQQYLTKFGIDTPLKLNVNFSRTKLLDIFGEELIRVGDVLRIPLNIPGKKFPHYFLVTEAHSSSNFRFRWLYWTCQTVLLVNDDEVRPFIEIDKNMHWL